MLSLGYNGPSGQIGPVLDNPLAAVVQGRVRLYDYEAAQAIFDMSYPAWDDLMLSQKREIARVVLLQRGDDQSVMQAEQLGLNNPNFNQIELIYTQLDDKGHHVPVDSILQDGLDDGSRNTGPNDDSLVRHFGW